MLLEKWDVVFTTAVCLSLSWVEKTPYLVLAGEEANSTVELSLRDTKNKDVTSVRIGEFVQLVAYMTPGKQTS